MQKLIKDGLIIDDTWTFVVKKESVAKQEGDAVSAELPKGNIIIPLSVWQTQKNQLQSRLANNEIAIWLDSDETADMIEENVNSFPIIGVNFPIFMDGRAFSTARLLRERYGFKGELRATGNFIRDQLCYLRRCGVNCFAFANPEINLEEAINSLNDFQEYYQASVDQPLPLFRRRV
jgi:uncharacterized protein (DUF934 family)